MIILISSKKLTDRYGFIICTIMLFWMKFATLINPILPFITFYFERFIEFNGSKMSAQPSLKSSGNILLLIFLCSGKRNERQSFVNAVRLCCSIAIIIHKCYKRIRNGIVSKPLNISGNSCKIKKEFSRYSDVMIRIRCNSEMQIWVLFNTGT